MQVDLPTAEADAPPWARVSLIAAVGFVVGVAWPKLAGVSLAPNPPSDGRREAPAVVGSSGAGATTTPKAAGSVPTLAAVAPAGGVAGGGGPVSAFEQTVVVGPVDMGKCRGEKGKAVDKCDDIAVDGLFVPKLREVARCPSAMGLAGKLTFGIDLDFKQKTIKVQRPKSKLPRTTVDGVTRCVERGFNGLSLDDLTHENVRYSLSYTLTFYPPGKAPDAGEAPTGATEGASEKPGGEAGGKAVEVRWNSCQVRATPKDGQVVGKVSRGQSVKLLEQKEGWSRIEFGDRKQGWVTSQALGG